MMSALLIEQRSNLYDRVVSGIFQVISDDPSYVCLNEPEPGMAQAIADRRGRLLSVHNYGSDDCLNSPDLQAAYEDLTIPAWQLYEQCSVECRWKEIFVDIVQRLGIREIPGLMVLDSDDVLWDARRLDVSRIAL